MKQAVIDIGSNSMRLSVYETTEAGTFTILFKDKIMAGLAGYVEEGALSPEGITRAILGLRSFRGTLRALNIPQVAVFATASLRNIRNTAQAVAEIQRGTGFAIEVLSGEEEARLGYAGAMEELALSEGLFVDIGGASTEVVRFAHGQLVSAVSCPVGSLKLYRDWVKKILPRSAQARTPSRLWTVIWVEAWRGRSGQVRRSRRATPRSCTRTASIPRSEAQAPVSAARGNSRLVSRVLRVR